MVLFAKREPSAIVLRPGRRRGEDLEAHAPLRILPIQSAVVLDDETPATSERQRNNGLLFWQRELAFICGQDTLAAERFKRRADITPIDILIAANLVDVTFL